MPLPANLKLRSRFRKVNPSFFIFKNLNFYRNFYRAMVGTEYFSVNFSSLHRPRALQRAARDSTLSRLGETSSIRSHWTQAP